MARACKGRFENEEGPLPIRTTPRKRKHVEYAQAESEVEQDISDSEPVNGTSAASKKAKSANSKASGKAGRPTRVVANVAVEEEVGIKASHVNANTAIISKSTKTTVKAKKEQPTTDSKNAEAVGSEGNNLSNDKAAEQPKKKRKTKEEKEAEAMPLAARTAGLKFFVGAHISIAKGVENAITNSVNIGGNAFACFLKSQRKWDNPALKDENRDLFKQHLITHKYDGASHIVPHGSYLVNLASADKDMAKKSFDAFVDDLKRCDALGIGHYNFHPGAAGQAPMQEAIRRLAGNLNRALANTTTVTALLENMATRGSIIGGRFQDIRDVIALIKDEYKSRIGVCIDTCHAFASGYDLRTPEAFKKTLDEFDEVVGMKYLKALHLNDSKAPFASNRDLHQNIGLGFLGLRAFHNVMNEPRFHNLPLILETPCGKPDPNDPKGKKTVEDKSVWAKEIKLLEGLTGMDAESTEFKKLEKELSDQGRAERAKLQKQFDEKLDKEAEKLAKEEGKGQKSLKDMFGGQTQKGKTSKASSINSRLSDKEADSMSDLN